MTDADSQPVATNPAVLAYESPPSRRYFWRTTLAHAFGAFCGAGAFAIPTVIRSIESAKFFAASGLSPTPFIIRAVVFCTMIVVFMSAMSAIVFGAFLTKGIKHSQHSLRRHAWLPAFITGATGLPGMWLAISLDRLPGLLVLFLGAGWFLLMQITGFWLSFGPASRKP